MNDAGKPRILIVDRNESALEETAAMLKERHDQATVETATTADEARDHIHSNETDVIVASNDLGGETGLAFLESIRDSHPDLPVVLYPREGSEKLASEAIHAGVTDYVARSHGTNHTALLAARIGRLLDKPAPNATAKEESLEPCFEAAITDLASELLDPSCDTYETAIESVLQKVGNLVEGDRAFVYQIQKDQTVEKTHEWRGEGVDSGLETGQSVPKYKLSWWIDQLESFEPVVIPSVENLPKAASIEQELLEEQPVVSLVTVPMVREDELIGFVGVDRIEPKGGWKADQTELLQAAGELVNGALERETRHQELKRREAYLDQSSDVISVMNADGSIKFQSESTERVTDFSPADVMGQSGFDHIHPADEEQVITKFGTFVAEPGAEVTGELRVKAKDGGWRWIEVRGVNKLNDPLIEGLLFSSRDITERKEREKSHQRLKERLELAVEGAGLGVWDWNMRTDDVEFNEQWAQMLGYSLDDIEPRLEAWENRVHPDDIDAVEAALEDHIAGKTAFYDSEHRIRTADGDWKWIRDIGKVFEREDGEPVRAVGIHLDIDERKAYETELEQSRKTLRQIIDLVPDLIFAKNRAGEYLLANEKTADLYGMSPDDVEGKQEAEVIPSIEDSEAFREDDLEVIKSGEAKLIPEEELTTASGETRILETTKIPFELPGSGEEAILGYARDVTDLKAYEQELESQRDTLQILNQVVRHDIRNQLQVVLASAELARSNHDLPEDSPLNQVISAAQEAIEITDVAREVADFMEDPDTKPVPVELRSVLTDVLEEVTSSYDDATVRIAGSIPEETVMADDLLESVFRNLLTNGIRHNDKEEPVVNVSTSVGKSVLTVRIADNGPGIPDEQKAEIFEQGESGLESSGSGLGLYLVETLVDRYGGTLSVEDNEPTGSVFVLELPLA